MGEFREALEERQHALLPRPGGFDRLVRRRRRRHRNRQIGAICVAFVVAAAGVWGVSQVVRNGGLQGKPAQRIDRSNVSRLRVAWTARIGGRPSDPVVSNGIVYVVADRLYAFKARCSVAQCQPLWTAAIGQGSSGHAPVVADGVVVVSSESLYAFPATCAGPTCTPLWTAAPPTPSGSEESTSVGFSAPAVSNGVVYVSSGGGLYAFPVRCGSGGRTCRPLWVGVGSGSSGAPAVDRGMVFFSSHTKLWAFRTVCPEQRCKPVWVVAWPPPELVNSEASALVASGGTLYAAGAALSPSCGLSGQCTPLWIAGTGPQIDDPDAGILSSVTVSGDVVYVSSTNVHAFPAECGTSGGDCAPLWVGPKEREQLVAGFHRWSQPTVANGLVFSATDRPYAFTVGCASGGAACRPVWMGSARIAQFFSRVTVVNSAVYVTVSDGTLLSLTVDGR